MPSDAARADPAAETAVPTGHHAAARREEKGLLSARERNGAGAGAKDAWNVETASFTAPSTVP